MSEFITDWPVPAPWVVYLAQCVILDHRDGKVRTCDHDPRPVFAGDITDDTPPVVHDADTRWMECLKCFTATWGRRATTRHRPRCVQCGHPARTYRAPATGYPNLFLTVSACTDHGPGGDAW